MHTLERALEPEAGEPLTEGSGGQAGFRDVFLMHYGPIVAVLLRLTGNRGDAEELANEVFWRFSQRLRKGTENENVGGWLYRTATRLGLDWLRAERRRSRRDWAFVQQSGCAQTETQLAEVLRREQAGRVRATLAKLKPKQVELLLLRAGAASYEEIARKLEMAPGSVGTLLSRAEAEFRKQFARAEAQAARRGNQS